MTDSQTTTSADPRAVYRVIVHLHQNGNPYPAFADQRLQDLYSEVCQLEGVSSPAALWPGLRLDIDLGRMWLGETDYRMLCLYRREPVRLTNDAIHDIVNAVLGSTALNAHDPGHRRAPRKLMEHLVPNVDCFVRVEIN